MTGSGFFDDGFGGHDMINLPGWAPTDSSTLPRRKLIQATLQQDNQTAQLLLSPSAHVDISGGMEYPFSYYPLQGGATARGYPGINEEVHPVLLTQPSPLGHPELGDGTNQYAYDSQSFFDGQSFIHGRLAIPAQGAITGQNASSDDANWLVGGTGPLSSSHVSWLVLPSIANPQPFTTTASGAGFGAQRGGYDNNYQSYPYGSLGFNSMTASNGDFGFHQLNLMVDGSVGGTANFQTFFPGLAANHPDINSPPSWDGSAVPNFYYYYSQLYLPSGKWEPDTGQLGVWDFGNSSHTDPTPPFDIHIHNDAYCNPNDGSTDITWGPVFALDPGPGSKVYLIGRFRSIKGIHRFIAVCAHEAGHQMVLSGSFDDPGIPAWNPDADGDGLGSQMGDKTLPQTR